ncbi:Putative carbohydrate-binding WSC [Colletotrichum destructivum]|uniref:Carbohydrate-binding WSC n=1 Tax=Colletotrichum destructivum TaxID=34406 RepID=A0AAX4J451_9PEZI|nr:Putative carbohydrate-binding WSC [Colletotrichum destructivum]
MLSRTIILAQVLLALLSAVVSLTVTEASSYLEVAQSSLADNRLSVVTNSVSGRGNFDTFGSYTNGPFGIGPGAMHATGLVRDAVAGQTPNTQYSELNEPQTRCGVQNEAWEIALLTFTINTPPEVTDLQVNFVFALQEPANRNPDSMQIIFNTNDVQLFDNIQWLSSSSPLITTTPAGTGISHARSTGLRSITYTVKSQQTTFQMFICEAISGVDDVAVFYNIVGLTLPQTTTITTSSTTSSSSSTTTTTTTTTEATSTTTSSSSSTTTTATTESTSTTTSSSSSTATTTTTTTATSSTSSSSSTTTTADTSSTSSSSSTATTTTTTTATSSTSSSSSTTTTADTSSTSSSSSTTTTAATSLTASSSTSDSSPGSTLMATSSLLSSESTTLLSPSFSPNTSSSFEMTITSSLSVLPSSGLSTSTSLETLTTSTSQFSTSFSQSLSTTSSIQTPSITATLSSSSRLSLTSSNSITGSVVATNLPNVDNYAFIGCLGSPSGFGSFVQVGQDPNMTQERCVNLSQGRQYGGVFNDTCFVSDLLQGTALFPAASCNLPCPGNAGQICGGLTNATTLGRRSYYGPQVSRRAASPNILLTLFGRVETVGSTTIPSNAGPSGSTIGPPLSSVSPVPLSGSSSLNSPTLPNPSSLVTLENLPPGFSSVSLTLGGVEPIVTSGTTTRIRSNTQHITSIVTTIFYTTVDPVNPTAVVETELHTTIYFEDCGCPTQSTPSICMVTTVAQCHRCGLRGEDKVTLVVPSLSDSLPQNQVSLTRDKSPSSLRLVEFSHETQSSSAATLAVSSSNHLVTLSPTVIHGQSPIHTVASSSNHLVTLNPAVSQGRSPTHILASSKEMPVVPNQNMAAPQSSNVSTVETVVTAIAPSGRQDLYRTEVFRIVVCVLAYTFFLS